MNNYVCNVCGSEYDNLDGYLACVTKCVETKKSKERIKKIDTYLAEINEAEKWLREVMKKFKDEFPEEFYCNFGTEEDECKCECENNCECNYYKEEVTKETPRSMEFYYEKNGKHEPKMTTKVNGKEVNKDSMRDLFKDRDVNYLAKLLGII